jgi:putative heme degradation protein
VSPAVKVAAMAALAAIAGEMVVKQFTDNKDSDSERTAWRALGAGLTAFALYKLV